MSLSSTTLAVIQKAGAAAFAADVKLKNAVKDYAERVNAAMLNNPDGLGNDVLFANWKIVSRLSQTLTNIEEEIRELFLVASDLGTDKQVAVKTVAPVAKTKPAAKKKAARKAEAVTETVALAVPVKATKTTKKSIKKASAKKALVAPAVAEVAAELPVKAPAKSKVKTAVKATAKVKVKAVKSKVKNAAKAPRATTLGANPTKVLRHLETLLNVNDFTVISQTAVSKETGIPLGSMTAATKKLLETGHLVAGPSGSFKLVNAPTVSAE